MDWIQQLFTSAPWPLRASAWVISLFLLWLLISVPAWLLSGPLAEAYRLLDLAAVRLWARANQVRQLARLLWEATLAEIAASRRVIILKNSHMDSWHASVTQAILPIERLLTSLTTAIRDM